MANTLAVFDVSPFIYKGHFMKTFDLDTLYDFPIKGVRYLLKYITKEMKFNNDIVLCFDSKSFRKKILKTYKAHRTPCIEVYAQLDFLYKYLTECGFVCYKQDDYEADDFIYNVCFANAGKYRNIKIYGVDYDLTHNVDEYGTVFESISSQVYSVDKDNFGTILGSEDEEVYFNTITAYKIFVGDKSDNVKSFTSEKGYRGIDIYKVFVDVLKEQCSHENSYYTKSRDVLWYFIENCGYFTEKDLKELKLRLDVFYPAIITENVEGIPYNYGQVSNLGNINRNMYGKLTRTVKDFDSTNILELDAGGSSPAVKEYLYTQAKALKEGSYGVNTNLPKDFSRLKTKSLILNGF